MKWPWCGNVGKGAHSRCFLDGQVRDPGECWPREEGSTGLGAGHHSQRYLPII